MTADQPTDTIDQVLAEPDLTLAETIALFAAEGETELATAFADLQAKHTPGGGR